MTVSDEIEIGSAVFFRCSNPATGFIKRMAKNREWADVQWNFGLDCTYVKRAKMVNLIKLTPILNAALDSKGESTP